LLVCGGPAWATAYPSGTYYIDFTLGSDASADPTNIATPWKTLDMVTYNTFAAPTTIRLKKGETWNGFLTVPSSGTLGNEFTITSYGATGAKPIIKRTGVITDHSNTGWTNVSGAIWSYPQTVATWLYENGKMLKMASDNTLADGNWWSTTDIVYYKAKVGSTPADNLIEYSGTFSFTASDRDYVIVDGIHFTQGAWLDTHTADRTNLTIKNCDFSQMRAGPFIGSSGSRTMTNITIENCTFDYNAVNVYLSNGFYSNAVIQNNVITHSNQTYWDEPTTNATDDYDGLSLQNLSNSTVKGNDISGGCVASAGIYHWICSGCNVTGTVITQNYIHDIEGVGIKEGGEDTGTVNIQITYNVIKNVGIGQSDPSTQGGIWLNRIQTSGTPSLVANNTIYGGLVGINVWDQADYFTIKNNIVSGASTYLARVYSTGTHNVFSNNLYYPGSVGTPFYTPYEATNWAGWAAVYTEANSLTSDPLFVSTTDFHLQSGSPAINAGANVSLTTDYAGRTVPQGAAPDIGSYEWYPVALKICTGAAPKIGVGSAITVY
jgi:hypothetical protein